MAVSVRSYPPHRLIRWTTEGGQELIQVFEGTIAFAGVLV